MTLVEPNNLILCKKRKIREWEILSSCWLRNPLHNWGTKWWTIFLWLISTTKDTSTSSGHFGGMTPFKVQVNFDIPVFEVQIGANDLEKWVNLFEGYFFVYNISNRENITFSLLKAIPHVKYWWETYYEQTSIEKSEMLGTKSTWASSVDALKGQYYLVRNYED